MKSHTVLIILIIIAAIAVFSFTHVFNNSPEVDAKKFFEEDLQESYPNADIREILSVNKVGTGYSEYYILRARVSSQMDTPCPERIEVEYNYPSRNFVKTDEKIVYGCQVCIENTQNCYVSYPEEAIIASHTYPQTQRISDYLSKYPNAFPQSALLPTFGDEKNVWEVQWDSDDAPYVITAYISQSSNEIVSIETQDK